MAARLQLPGEMVRTERVGRLIIHRTTVFRQAARHRLKLLKLFFRRALSELSLLPVSESTGLLVRIVVGDCEPAAGSPPWNQSQRQRLMRVGRLGERRVYR